MSAHAAAVSAMQLFQRDAAATRRVASNSVLAHAADVSAMQLLQRDSARNSVLAHAAAVSAGSA